jgi:hypothetical protein
MSDSSASIIYDEVSEQPVGVVLDGTVYRLQVEARIPSGAANLQKVYLVDGVNEIELAVADEVAVPTNTRSLLTSGIDSTDKARRISAVADGTSHRLMVDAKAVLVSTASVIDFVKNGGSEDLQVDGATTPVIFTFDADATDDIILTHLVLCMSAMAVDLDGGSFASGNALTNGLLVQATVNDGTAVAIGTFKQNEDFRRLLDTDLAQGGTRDNMTGVISFGGRMILKGGTSDKVEVIVRDDLTTPSLGLEYLTATVYGLKE